VIGVAFRAVDAVGPTNQFDVSRRQHLHGALVKAEIAHRTLDLTLLDVRDSVVMAG
jgi:hypothetical protein